MSNDIVKTMIKIWDMNTMDWMGYNNEEKYSYHHIVKKCDGGNKLPPITNGSVLHINSHSYLHTIEHYDYDKYVFLNKILKQVNEQRYMTTQEQLEQIRYVLLEFQNEYEGKVSSRGKPIIKKEYIIER